MTDEQLRELGQIIKAAREKKGLSLRQFATAVGINASNAMRLENGEVREPKAEVLAACTDVLGIKASRIDRVTSGYLSGGLIPSRTYMRARYDLTPEQTEHIEAEIAKLKGGRKEK